MITRLVGLLAPALWVLCALATTGAGHAAIALAVVTVLVASYAIAAFSGLALAVPTPAARVGIRRGWTGSAANEHAHGVIDLVLLSKPRR